MKNNILIEELMNQRDNSRAALAQRYFKTGKGEYGEGDRFLGLSMPAIRKIVNEHYKNLSLADLEQMLGSQWHEVRMAAVVAMNKQYPKSPLKQQIYDLYLSQIGKGINNWDLVDISCPHIIGAYLFDKNRQPLYDLAQKGLWHKRVAIISTFYFLRYDDEPADTYKLAEILVNDQHDLLQKAVGWALREMGKKDPTALYKFLDKYASNMPRTALRYSLEKLTYTEKQKYMHMNN